MKNLSLFVLFFLSAVFNHVIFSAPLNGNYPLAPDATAEEARLKVIEAGKKYEGTPYLYTGITERGMDCSGFIYASFYDALGMSVPRSSSALYSWVEAISLDNAQSGDLLFFKTNGSRVINHVGLYIGDRRFIHATSSGPKTGVIYSSLDERYWTNAYFSAGRVLPAVSSGLFNSIESLELSEDS